MTSLLVFGIKVTFTWDHGKKHFTKKMVKKSTSRDRISMCTPLLHYSEDPTIPQDDTSSKFHDPSGQFPPAWDEYFTRILHVLYPFSHGLLRLPYFLIDNVTGFQVTNKPFQSLMAATQESALPAGTWLASKKFHQRQGISAYNLPGGR